MPSRHIGSSRTPLSPPRSSRATCKHATPSRDRAPTNVGGHGEGGAKVRWRVWDAEQEEQKEKDRYWKEEERVEHEEDGDH